MFEGVFTALVTPFDNNKIDFESLKKLIAAQLDAGIQGFVVCGTTAESPTLSEDEQLEILEFVCKEVGGQVPIIFGSGSNSTSKSIAMSQRASQYPIAALLVVVPYYNKPTQEGLIAHFTSVADNCKNPIILYNVPGRTITSLEPATIIELSKHPNIVGIKEADGSMDRFSSYKDKVTQGFALLSGDDETSIDFCLLGGHGVISVCSHIGPDKMVSWISRARDGDTKIASEFESQKQWINSLYLSSNPIPVKAALYCKKIIKTKEMRLPLTPMAFALENQMVETLKQAGCL